MYHLKRRTGLINYIKRPPARLKQHRVPGRALNTPESEKAKQEASKTQREHQRQRKRTKHAFRSGKCGTAYEPKNCRTFLRHVISRVLSLPFLSRGFPAKSTWTCFCFQEIPKFRPTIPENIVLAKPNMHLAPMVWRLRTTAEIFFFRKEDEKRKEIKMIYFTKKETQGNKKYIK